jgi:hypothetical protein
MDILYHRRSTAWEAKTFDFAVSKKQRVNQAQTAGSFKDGIKNQLERPIAHLRAWLRSWLVPPLPSCETARSLPFDAHVYHDRGGCMIDHK